MKRMKQILSVILVLLSLSSCAVMDKLGFDTYDYMSETVTLTHGADSETAEALGSVLSVLITDSVILPTFDGMGEAIDLYRDAVLTHMLETGYSKYSGNRELIEKALEAYPGYQITQIIPADDFERTMYETFGGDVKISHKDGSVFKYLKKVESYVCGIAPKDSGIEPQIISVEETERTYRVRFRPVSGETVGDEYFALIIKREDGTRYFKKLLTEWE